MLSEQIYFPIAEAALGAGLAFGEPNWYAVHTMARHEKRVATQLQEERVFAFLPLVQQLHRWSDRQSKVDLPLFSCYVFVRIVPTTENRVRVLQTPGVVGFVGSKRQGTPIASQEIESLRTATRGKARFQTHPFVNTGKRVRVRGGALDGVEGIIQCEGEDLSLVLSVELLRRSVSIRVEGYDVELV
jgi:transcription antitermination factor NusG